MLANFYYFYTLFLAINIPFQEKIIIKNASNQVRLVNRNMICSYIESQNHRFRLSIYPSIYLFLSLLVGCFADLFIDSYIILRKTTRIYPVFYDFYSFDNCYTDKKDSPFLILTELYCYKTEL